MRWTIAILALLVAMPALAQAQAPTPSTPNSSPPTPSSPTTPTTPTSTTPSPTPTNDSRASNSTPTTTTPPPQGPPPSRGLALDLAPPNASVAAGEGASFVVTIRNLGASPERASLHVAPTANLSFSIQPTDVVDVAPGASANLTLLVASDANATPGDRPFDLGAISTDGQVTARATGTLHVTARPMASPSPPPTTSATMPTTPATSETGSAPTSTPPASTTPPPSRTIAGTNATREDAGATASGTTAPPPPPPSPNPIDIIVAHPVATSAVAATGAVSLAWLFSRREAWRYALLAPLLPLYSRLTKSDVLDHETRDQVFALIRDHPGITYTELLRECGLNRGALLHHLRQLEVHEFVIGRREGTHRRFYPSGARLPIVVPLTDAQQRVLSLLTERGPMTQREIAEAMGVSQQGASFHLKALQRAGHVEKREDAGAGRGAQGAVRWDVAQGPPSHLRP